MFFSIPRKPQVVYPGINFSAYDPPPDLFDDKNVKEIMSWVFLCLFYSISAANKEQRCADTTFFEQIWEEKERCAGY